MQSSSARASRQKMRASPPPGDAGEHAALQRAIDVHRPAGDDLGARGDAADHGHVAFEMHDLLAGAQVALVVER